MNGGAGQPPRYWYGQARVPLHWQRWSAGTAALDRLRRRRDSCYQASSCGVSPLKPHRLAVAVRFRA